MPAKQIYTAVPTTHPMRLGNRYGQQQQSGIQGAGTSVGTAIGDIGGTIAKAIQSAKQNQVANQLLNTNWTTPRAALVSSPTPVAAGVNTGGTAPATGGVGELDLRMKEAQVRDALAKSQASTAEMAAKSALQQQVVQQGGSGGGRSPWARGGGGSGNANTAIANAANPNPAANPRVVAAGKTAKPAPYQAGSIDPQDPAADNFSHLQTDINTQYGDKNMYQKLLTAAGAISQNPDGTYASSDPKLQIDPKNGALTFTDKNGDPTAHIPGPDVAQFRSRYDAARVKAGQSPLFNSTLATQNPGTGDPGTQLNPYAPSTNLELRSLKPGSWFTNPKDGKVYQKPDPSAAATSPTTATMPPVASADAGASPAVASTDQAAAPVDTSGQSMPAVAAAPSDNSAQIAQAIAAQNAGDQVAANQAVPNVVPPPPASATGSSDDETLMSAIQRAQLANQVT